MRVCRTCGAYVDRNAPAHGLESGFIRKIISKIEGESTAKLRFGKEMLHGHSLAKNTTRNDLHVSEIVDQSQRLPIGQQKSMELAPGPVLVWGRHIEQVD